VGGVEIGRLCRLVVPCCLIRTFLLQDRNDPDLDRRNTEPTIDGFVLFTLLSAIPGLVLFNQDSEEGYFVALIPLSLVAALVGYFRERAQKRRGTIQLHDVEQEKDGPLRPIR
jgi:hypothetical protein